MVSHRRGGGRRRPSRRPCTSVRAPAIQPAARITAPARPAPHHRRQAGRRTGQHRNDGGEAGNRRGQRGTRQQRRARSRGQGRGNHHDERRPGNASRRRPPGRSGSTRRAGSAAPDSRRSREYRARRPSAGPRRGSRPDHRQVHRATTRGGLASAGATIRGRPAAPGRRSAGRRTDGGRRRGRSRRGSALGSGPPLASRDSGQHPDHQPQQSAPPAASRRPPAANGRARSVVSANSSGRVIRSVSVSTARSASSRTRPTTPAPAVAASPNDRSAKAPAPGPATRAAPPRRRHRSGAVVGEPSAVATMPTIGLSPTSTPATSNNADRAGECRPTLRRSADARPVSVMTRAPSTGRRAMGGGMAARGSAIGTVPTVATADDNGRRRRAAA